MSTFPAKYRGTCAEGDRIELGDEVAYATDGTLAHVGCSSKVAGGPSKGLRTPSMCDRCFLVHRGECF